MSDTALFFETSNNLQKAEFEFMKQFINYDDLIDNLIKEKETKILECQIKIKQIEFMMLTNKNDIERVKEEQKNSNYKYCHIFINPHKVYYDMTKK
jgi:hypothetical protein